MNTYTIFLENTELQLTRPVIEDHVAHLKKLYAEGSLLLSGPFTDYPGGMLVIRCYDIQTAHQIAKQDPFVIGGYRTYSIRTLEVADETNNFLL